MTADELKVIADLTMKLTDMRMVDCPHLCIKNFAPEIFAKLVFAYERRGALTNDFST